MIFVMPAAVIVGAMTLFMTLVPCVSEVAMIAALFAPSVCAAYTDAAALSAVEMLEKITAFA